MERHGFVRIPKGVAFREVRFTQAQKSGIQPLRFLDDKIAANGKVRWLDLCCGTGKELIRAATIIERDGLPIKIV